MILLAAILIAILRLIVEVANLFFYLIDFHAVMYNALNRSSGHAIKTWAVQCILAQPVIIYMSPNAK